jgi:phage tail sheath protein FI
MANLGVHVYEQATAVSVPVVADVGIPYVVGTAPVHMAENPAKINTPVVVTSWDEAVEKLGFSYDWKKFTLCEFMYSHFQLFGCQPVVFCNVLDPTSAQTDAEEKDVDVSEHKAILPLTAIIDDQFAVKSGDSTLTVDEDYSVLYDENLDACVVELLGDGTAYDTKTLTITYREVKTDSVTVADIVMGVGQADACMTAAGVIPDLLCAPGWSHNSVVAAVMATKAAGINGLFRAKALIDCDSGTDGVRQYSDLVAYKAKNNFVDENQVLCWPMVKLGDYAFHLSTQLAGLIAKVDTDNAGVPYESPSNKNLKMDTCCLEDGTEVNLTWDQVKLVAGSYGVVTALNFMGMGWVAKGNYTACYPSNTDVKDMFLCVSRMFDFVGNTLVKTFWSKLDKPTNRRLIDNILDTCNIWLAGLVGSEYLLGARAEMLDSENPLTDLMDGIIRIHIYMTPPAPAQEIDFTLEYDTAYVESALAA